MDEKTLLKLNTRIFSTAVINDDTCIGDPYGGAVFIHWNMIDRYLLVYIESYDPDMELFRIFELSRGATYDRRKVLDPPSGNEEFKYLYESVEDHAGRRLIYCALGGWEERVLREFDV